MPAPNTPDRQESDAESGSAEVLTTPSPLLTLVGNLIAATSQSPALSGKALRVRGAEPRADGMSLDVEAEGINALVNGRYRVDLAILRTSRESTLADVRIAEGRMVGRLFDWARKLVPGSLVNTFLQGKAGGAIRMEGDRIALDHKALIAWLRQRRKR